MHWQVTGANTYCSLLLKRPADCEIWSVIRFLNARNVKPADMHGQICEVYDNNVMSDGMVKKWIRKFWKAVITCMTSRGAAGRL